MATAAAAALLMLSGCSLGDQSDGSADVASLETQAPVSVPSTAYVNDETAAYAECLGDLGIAVSAVPADSPGKEEMAGYAEIDGAAALVVDGVLEVSPDAPIGVDGEDRDAEIRQCYADHSGAKDVLLDQDFHATSEDAAAGYTPEQLESGRRWAQCAREQGISTIGDPPTSGRNEGMVVIPAEVTLDEAEMLGEECSRPLVIAMLEGEPLLIPLFQLEVLGDLTPFDHALQGPELEVMNKCAAGISVDDCLAKLGW